jgi:hypothetical protein
MIYSKWIEKTWQTRVPYLAKLFLKYEGQIKDIFRYIKAWESLPYHY